MTTIDGVAFGAGLARPGRRRLATDLGAGPFRVPEGESASAAPMTPAPIALDGLLGLQEAGGDPGAPEPRAESAGRRLGVTLLNDLSALQQTLLGASANSAAVAERLHAILAAPMPLVSPSLQAVLAGLRLRARVELARRGWPAHQ